MIRNSYSVLFSLLASFAILGSQSQSFAADDMLAAPTKSFTLLNGTGFTGPSVVYKGDGKFAALVAVRMQDGVECFLVNYTGRRTAGFIEGNQWGFKPAAGDRVECENKSQNPTVEIQVSYFLPKPKLSWENIDRRHAQLVQLLNQVKQNDYSPEVQTLLKEFGVTSVDTIEISNKATAKGDSLGIKANDYVTIGDPSGTLTWKVDPMRLNPIRRKDLPVNGVEVSPEGSIFNYGTFPRDAAIFPTELVLSSICTFAPTTGEPAQVIYRGKPGRESFIAPTDGRLICWINKPVPGSKTDKLVKYAGGFAVQVSKIDNAGAKKAISELLERNESTLTEKVMALSRTLLSEFAGSLFPLTNANEERVKAYNQAVLAEQARLAEEKRLADEREAAERRAEEERLAAEKRAREEREARERTADEYLMPTFSQQFVRLYHSFILKPVKNASGRHTYADYVLSDLGTELELAKAQESQDQDVSLRIHLRESALIQDRVFRSSQLWEEAIPQSSRSMIVCMKNLPGFLDASAGLANMGILTDGSIDPLTKNLNPTIQDIEEGLGRFVAQNEKECLADANNSTFNLVMKRMRHYNFCFTPKSYLRKDERTLVRNVQFVPSRIEVTYQGDNLAGAAFKQSYFRKSEPSYNVLQKLWHYLFGKPSEPKQHPFFDVKVNSTLPYDARYAGEICVSSENPIETEFAADALAQALAAK